MAYEFKIETREELESLQWLSERYDYANAIETALTNSTTIPAEWSIDSELYPVVFDMPEHCAWEIQAAVEAEDGYLTCLGGRLKTEVENLLSKIV